MRIVASGGLEVYEATVLLTFWDKFYDKNYC